jgi:acyl-coenzyme A synthetase/AMP-(fatty) acid ligase
MLKPGVEKVHGIGKELIQYVKDKKVRYKWIKEVELVDEIPKCASGKILRRVLRGKVAHAERGSVVTDGVTEKAKL